MKAKLTSVFCAMILFIGFRGNAGADVNIGVTADESGIREFHLAVGDFYRVPEKEIIIVRDKGIPDDDLPVVFFLAQRAGVSPLAIIKMRLAGSSWIDITLHFGLSPEIYYIELKNPGPPYGKAYGYFKNKPRKEWGSIRLVDADIVNFVNLRFLSTHYGHSPDEIIKMRHDGSSFVGINGKVKKAKQGKNDDKPAKVARAKGANKKTK